MCSRKYRYLNMLLEDVYNFNEEGEVGYLYAKCFAFRIYLYEAIYTVEIIERKANGCSDNRTLG